MKKILRIPLLLVALFLTSIPISAYDFYDDGIYYNIISSTDKTVAITNNGNLNPIVGHYKGNIIIPEIVTYYGTTYSVTSIGDYAFYKCSNLTSVTIPNSVTTIGNGAFEDCTGLTEVTIPNSVTSIGYNPFYDCSGLTSIRVGSENTTYDSRNNCNAIIETASNTLVTGCENTIIPNTVTSIDDYAFRGCTGLTSIEIPNSVTEIGNTVFSGCTGLTSVTIPNSVTSIGYSAFYGCTGLRTVNFNATNCNSMGGSSYPVFYGCTALSRLNFGNNVTNIPSAAFYGCTSLGSIDIPNSVTKIGHEAFYGCTGLGSIDIPNSVTEIGDYAFHGCTGLTFVTIPNSVTEIGDYAFHGCTGLRAIEFSATNCTSMGSSRYPVFYDCTALSILGISTNVTNIPSYAFHGCTGLTSVTIPNSVTAIGKSAFSGCTGLTDVTIGNSVTSIGDYAFSDCVGLTTVNFNATNCTTMGSYSYPVFNGCTAFTTLNIGDNVTNIPSSAFKGCTGLTSVAFSNSLSAVGDSAFYDCTGLTEVNITDLSAWCKIDFANIDANPLSYACHLKLNSTEITNLIIPSDITAIKNYTFNSCSGLTSVTIPESIITISKSAFSGCTSLTTVNFNATNCTTMGSSSSPVFSGCTALTTLNIGDNVTNIPTYAFKGCSSLTSIAIPNSETSIGYQAFWGCDKLINNSVTTTQTTATINLTSPTQYNLGAYYSDSDKMQAENGVVKFTGLKPGYTNSNYDLALIINGIYCPIKDLSFTTKSFHAYISGSATTTSVSAIGTYTEGDVTILGKGINYGSSVTNYDGNNTITVNNLDPNRSYTIYYAVKTQEGGVYSTSKLFTTGALTWSNGGFTATSTTSARLNVETSCDATAGTGFEWKRYDAPESLAPSKAPCPVVDGMLVGSLRNLNPDVYYKCRPYYTSSSGNTYYGEWITFFTGDANVYFEPEVRTFSERSVVNNSATVKGYALAGTDDISEQGFEYWKTGSITPSSTDIRMTVKASGISMTATLADLEYNSTYRYRAYVKTAQGTFYGAEEEFSTGEDPAGIEYIEVDDSDSFDVMLRENPATATAWVKVAGASATEAEYYILTTNGGVVANGFIPADGEYQPIELNIANGLYLITVTDGTNIKTLRLIVR